MNRLEKFQFLKKWGWACKNFPKGRLLFPFRRQPCPWARKLPLGGVAASPLKPGRIPAMTLTTVLLIVLVLLLIGALPTWPHSSGWGYAPSGILGTILLIALVLWLLKVI